MNTNIKQQVLAAVPAIIAALFVSALAAYSPLFCFAYVAVVLVIGIPKQFVKPKTSDKTEAAINADQASRPFLHRFSDRLTTLNLLLAGLVYIALTFPVLIWFPRIATQYEWGRKLLSPQVQVSDEGAVGITKQNFIRKLLTFGIVPLDGVVTSILFLFLRRKVIWLYTPVTCERSVISPMLISNPTQADIDEYKQSRYETFQAMVDKAGWRAVPFNGLAEQPIRPDGERNAVYQFAIW